MDNREFKVDVQALGEYELARALLLIARELKRMNDIEVADRLLTEDDKYMAYAAEGWEK